MLGINIITKSGILVFRHGFTSSYYEDVDEELHAGLMTALLNALRETQKESIISIRQREDYVILLYEGVLTYGILPTTEEDPKLHEFLRNVVLKFELLYTKELHQDAIFDRNHFLDFRDIVKKMYSDMVEIDVNALDKIIKIMNKSDFSNYIIYETKFFHPVFKSILDSNISFHADKMTQIFRYIMDFGSRIKQEFTSGEFNFENIKISILKTPSHCIAVFNTINHNKEKVGLKKELNNIHKKILEQV
ncbi:MAG: hypothetical protein ACTSR2_03410 [Candidatus Hodarchaeales archaeon]